MRYFLYYGLIGNWIVSQFKTGSVIGILIAFCIIVLGAIVCDWILTDLKKKGENLLYIGAVCGYVLIYGLIILNCKMKLELRNWDKGACPFIPIRAVAGPLFSISV